MLGCILHGYNKGLDAFAGGCDTGHLAVHSDGSSVAAVAALDQVALEEAVADDVVGFGKHEADEAWLIDKVGYVTG